MMCSIIRYILAKLGSTSPPDFDVLTATAFQLQQLLSTRKITSVQLCQAFISQIKKHDSYLKAILAINPAALEHAAALDNERKHGRIRGPLHGIPFLLKVIDYCCSHSDTY